MLHLAIIMNDTPSMHKPLETESGLSMLVEYGNSRILFDTGYDDRFIGNAEKMGYSIDGLTSVILSHAHFDHVAGYAYLRERGLAPKSLFIGPHFFEPKYVKNGPVFTNLNSSLSRDEILSEGIPIQEVSETMKVSSGLTLVTCSAKSPYRKKVSDEYVKFNGSRFVEEHYEDEIALVAVTEHGLVLLTGRCHKGVCNVVHYIRTLSSRKIVAIIGGMDPTFSERELSYLEESGVRFIGICNNEFDAEKIPETGINISKVAVGDEFFF